jgi:hypothetical protein
VADGAVLEEDAIDQTDDGSPVLGGGSNIATLRRRPVLGRELPLRLLTR